MSVVVDISLSSVFQHNQTFVCVGYRKLHSQPDWSCHMFLCHTCEKCLLHPCNIAGNWLKRHIQSFCMFVCVRACVCKGLSTWGVSYIKILAVQTLFRTKAVQWAMADRIMCTPHKHIQRVKSVPLDLPAFSFHTHTRTGVCSLVMPSLGATAKAFPV